MLRASRGRKAGAINDALSVVKDADYVAIFDVDTRPDKDFIVKCVAALEEDGSAVHSSGCRFVTNKSNVLTKMVSIEYNFMCDVNRLFSPRAGGFTAMSCGLVKESFLEDEEFNEETLTEDFDFVNRMYLKGKVAVLANTAMGEQAPTTLKDLYHQRVRWYRGSVESFTKYFIPMFKAAIPFARKISWFIEVTLSYCPFLLTPFVISYLGKIKEQSDGPLEFVKIFLGGIGYTWLMTIIGIVAIIRHVTSSQSEWKPSARSDA
jgi:cellulose synthase/poly-beta-1,6-N-acetylglucosamine synthase-like glycosyltransferase